MQAVLDQIVRNIVPLGVLIVFGGTIIGIFRSKTPGFGKYTTSALLTHADPVRRRHRARSGQGRVDADGQYSVCRGGLRRRADRRARG